MTSGASFQNFVLALNFTRSQCPNPWTSNSLLPPSSGGTPQAAQYDSWMQRAPASVGDGVGTSVAVGVGGNSVGVGVGGVGGGVGFSVTAVGAGVGTPPPGGAVSIIVVTDIVL